MACGSSGGLVERESDIMKEKRNGVQEGHLGLHTVVQMQSIAASGLGGSITWDRIA